MSQQAPNLPQQPQVVYVERKKKHRFRNFVVLPISAVIALIVVIAVATSGGGEPASSSVSDRAAPRDVTVGKEFTIGKHRLDAGWKLGYQQFAGAKVTGTVTNVSKDTSTAIFHIKFLKGDTVVANMQCTSNDLEPNQKQAIECLDTVGGDKKLTGYTKVTAEATF